MYLNFRHVNGYFEEINGNKYLMLVPTNKRKLKIKKNEKLWIKIKDLISLNTKIMMMKNIWKSNLIEMTSYL